MLQEQEFERVGGETTQKVDVRLIAATNRDLEEEVSNKQFREDLFYRLNVFPVHIPPLRQRQEDLPLLIDHFLNKFSAKHDKTLEGISKDSLRDLLEYPWPGNIRELENVIERAVIVNRSPMLQIGEWFRKSSAPKEYSSSTSSSTSTTQPSEPLSPSSPFLSLEEMEKAHILQALEATKWRVGGDKGAAQLLGINRSTLRARMEKLGISREE